MSFMEYYCLKFTLGFLAICGIGLGVWGLYKIFLYKDLGGRIRARRVVAVVVGAFCMGVLMCLTIIP